MPTRLHPRHLDQRRLLTPREYATDPAWFGIDHDLPFIVPSGGDLVSMRIAREQHRLVTTWHTSGRRPSAALLCERFGMSKQTLSKVTRGDRWAGETVFAALAHAVSRRALHRDRT